MHRGRRGSQVLCKEISSLLSEPFGRNYCTLGGSLDKQSARKRPEQGTVRVTLADEGGHFSAQGCGQGY